MARDPWAAFDLHKRQMEHCRRLRFNPADGKWVADDVLVRGGVSAGGLVQAAVLGW